MLEEASRTQAPKRCEEFAYSILARLRRRQRASNIKFLNYVFETAANKTTGWTNFSPSVTQQTLHLPALDSIVERIVTALAKYSLTNFTDGYLCPVSAVDGLLRLILNKYSDESLVKSNLQTVAPFLWSMLDSSSIETVRL